MSLKATQWAWKFPLPSTQKLVLIALADFSDDEGIAWPSTARLMEMTGLSERAVKGARSALKASGLLCDVEGASRKKIRLRLNVSKLESAPRALKRASRAPFKSAPRAPLGAFRAPQSAPRAPINKNRQLTTKEPLSNPLTPLAQKKHSRGSPPELPDWLPLDAWNGWLEMRHKKHAPLTARGAELTLRKLADFRASGDDPEDVLDQSTERGWTGVFPLKSRGNVVPFSGAKSPHQQPQKSELSHPFEGFMEEFCGGTMPFYEHEGAERELLIRAGVIGA